MTAWKCTTRHMPDAKPQILQADGEGAGTAEFVQDRVEELFHQDRQYV